MLGMWCIFFITGGIPELATKPIEIGMHITAELLTASMLIIGGAGILLNKYWGMNIYSVSTEMLFYTLIVSPGYYIQRGNIGFVTMFAVFFVLSVLFMVLMLNDRSLNNLL